MTSAELSGSSVTWNLTTIFSLCFRTDALTVKSGVRGFILETVKELGIFY